MFGLVNLFTNTVTGVAEVAVNTVKAGVGVTVALADDGKILDDSLEGMQSGMKKIGNTDD